MSLASLQQVMEASLMSASPFARSLFERAAWGAEDVERFVNEVGNVTIATVGATGAPHAAPVIVGCNDGTMYFSVSRGSVLLRNLSHDVRAAFTVVALGHSVLGQGSVELVGASQECTRLADGLGRRLGALIVDEAWDGYLYSIQPRRLFAS